MDKETVHALREGLPLCGFSRDVPVNWPEGNFWTSAENVKCITCPTCKAEAEKLTKPN